MSFVLLSNLSLTAIVGKDYWEKSKEQPLLLSLRLYTPELQECGLTDSIDISYSSVAKLVMARVKSRSWSTVGELARNLSQHLHQSWSGLSKVELEVKLPRALLNGQVELSLTSSIHPTKKEEEREELLIIRDIQTEGIIGIRPWERTSPQPILFDLYCAAPFPEVGYRDLVQVVVKTAKKFCFKTVEATSAKIAEELLGSFANISDARVVVKKPLAVMFAQSAGACCLYRRSYSTSSRDLQNRAWIALGSNLGNRVENLEGALKKLAQNVRICSTSFLYKSTAMYYQDQPDFLNAVCEVETSFDDPQALLSLLKRIEVEGGRTTQLVEKGPRIIDLDLLMHGDRVINTEILTLPHPRMTEREFVLLPLNDIAPECRHPTLGHSMKWLLEKCPRNNGTTEKVFPIRNQFWQPSKRTYLMGILNCTPDSFSDGGCFLPFDAALDQARLLIEEGADIIDVGGQSTRPGAEDVSEVEEMSRVIPVIRAIRSLYPEFPISVDTFRPNVAIAAINAGADFVNDVSGSLGENPALFSSSLCLMHRRGDARTMNDLTQYQEVVKEVALELSGKVQRALSYQPRWRIWIDPGLGFAKTGAQNVELLRGLSSFAQICLPGSPVLLGPSRKRFIRTALESVDDDHVDGDDAKEVKEVKMADVDVGTVAVCTAAIQQGVGIVRVHNVGLVKSALKIGDMIWKPFSFLSFVLSL